MEVIILAGGFGTRLRSVVNGANSKQTFFVVFTEISYKI